MRGINDVMRRFSNETDGQKENEQSMKRRESKKKTHHRDQWESEELFKRSPMIVEFVHLFVHITENKISQRLGESRLLPPTDYNLHVE